MLQFPKILLASKSPRRQEILTKSGFDFELISIDAEENYPSELNNNKVCEYLALHKASHYAEPIKDQLLVTADTIVCIDNLVLNKPENEAHAFEMLRLLSGKKHTVYTGVCMKNDHKTTVFSEATQVEFYDLSDEEINHYIQNCQPFDKAGSYGIQDWMGYLGVKGINGCYFNVMGFPSARFYREIQKFY